MVKRKESACQEGMLIVKCPWCGKPVRGRGILSLLPVGGASVCPHCGESYAQKPYSFVLLLAVLAIMLIGAFVSLYWLIVTAVLLAGLVIYGLQLPYERVRVEGQWVDTLPEEARTAYKAILETAPFLRRGMLWYTLPDFAGRPPHSSAAPVRVERWRKSSRELTFTFLYNHDDNAVLLREGALTLWDEQGRQIARGRLVSATEQ